MKSRSVWFENGTEKARKLKKENSKRLIKSAILGNADIFVVVDEIAEERNDIKVGKINVDQENELAEAFGVYSIPTLVVMKDGKIVNQAIGARPKEQILAML